MNIKDSLSSFIFWSDWGKNAKIERAAYDGSYRKTVHSSGVGWPNGLTVDMLQERFEIF